MPRQRGGTPNVSRFLIELSHDPEEFACARVVKVFLLSGSHLLTNADWGCKDGVHNAWLIVEVDTKEEARLTIPVPFRAQAKIVALNKYELGEIEEILGRHRR
jgi:hypothetical protein